MTKNPDNIPMPQIPGYSAQKYRLGVCLATVLALFGAATAAQAGEILLVNAIDSVHGGIATYAYSQDGSGNFIAGSRSLLTASLRNSDWLTSGPNGTAVPNLWETDAYGGINRYSSAGTSLNYVQPTVLIDNQSQSVEDASGNAFVRESNTAGIEKVSPDGSSAHLISAGSGGLAIGPDGNLYTALYSGGIEKYSTSGSDLGQFGAYSGQPTQLAFDSHGDLFGLIGNTRIDEWGPDGTYLGIFKSGLPNSFGGGRRQDPNSFAIDSQNNIWLAQGYGSLYQITPNGTVTNFDGSNAGLQMFSVAVLDVTPSDAPEPATGFLFLGAGTFLVWGRRQLERRRAARNC